MVLDSRSRADSSESVNGNGANPSSNGNHATVEPINLSNPMSVVSVNKKKSIGQWWQDLNLRTKATIVSVAAITIPLLAIVDLLIIMSGKVLSNLPNKKKLGTLNLWRFGLPTSCASAMEIFKYLLNCPS